VLNHFFSFFVYRKYFYGNFALGGPILSFVDFAGAAFCDYSGDLVLAAEVAVE